MKKIAFIFSILLCCFNLYSQQIIPSQKVKPKFFFLLDTQHSFIGKKSAATFGIKGGLEFQNKYRFNIGYNWVTSDIVEKKFIKSENVIVDTANALLTMRYFSTGFAYVLYSKNPWEITLPVQLGIGKSYFEYYAKDNSLQTLYRHTVVPLEFGVAGHYKVLKWFGVGFGVGYRAMLVNNPEIDTKISSPTYAVFIKVFLGEIYKSVFPKRGLKEKK